MATAEQQAPGVGVVVGSIGGQLAAAAQPPVSMMDFVREISTPQALQAARDFANAYNHVCAALIGDDDVQKAEGGKVFKKKSAWRKLGRFFRVSTEVVHVEKGTRTDEASGECFYYAEVHVRATAPWGQSMVSVGACDTRERRFNNAAALQKAGNDVLATAETRATNRATSALIAAGEVSAEEVEGLDTRPAADPPATPQRVREARAAAVEKGAGKAWLGWFDENTQEPRTEGWLSGALADLDRKLADKRARAEQKKQQEAQPAAAAVGVVGDSGWNEGAAEPPLPFGAED